MPKKQVKIRWLEEVAKHDYASAESYLGLLYNKEQVRAMMAKLRKARVKEFKAKDIFRASRLPLLGAGNSHVQADEDKIKSGDGLSPLLLARDQTIGRVVIADGYHRLCAIYVFDEDAVIRCQII
jgi:hypothetical protein